MEGVPQQVCNVCKKTGHHPSSCPELTDPLKPEF